MDKPRLIYPKREKIFEILILRASVKGHSPSTERDFKMTMSAQIATQFDHLADSPAAEMHGGEATGLFTTSMVAHSADSLIGEGTELFTTSLAPQGSTMTGADTGLYTTSMVSGRDAFAGEATGLFTTSMAPKR